MSNLDNLREGDLCIIRHEGNEVRAIVVYTGNLDDYGTIDVHTIDGEFRITEADVVRKVTLLSYAATKCNLWEMAGCAADYIIASQSTEDALADVRRMIGKLNCYVTEAWLGGANVGEES